MKNRFKRAVSLLLLLCLLMGSTAMPVSAEEAEAETVPVEDQTGETAPEASLPEEPLPEETEPVEEEGFLTDDGHYIANPELLRQFDFPDTWSRPALEFAVGNGILNGRANGLAPTENTTRAEIASILVRLLGAQEQYASLGAYRDVSADAWYCDELSAAVAIGLVKGTSSNTISPNALVTREQACTMLCRAFGIFPTDVDHCDRFSDAGKISGYARFAVSAMAEQGYMSGYSDGTVRPQAYITREELSKLIYALITHVCDDVQALPSSGRVLYRGTEALPDGYSLDGDLTVGCGCQGLQVWNGLQISGRLVVRSAPGAMIDLYGCSAEILSVPAEAELSSDESVARLFTSGQGNTLDIAAGEVYVYGSCALNRSYDEVYCLEERTTVTVEDGLELLRVSAGKVQVTVNGDTEKCVLAGVDDIVQINGNVDECSLSANGIHLDVSGDIGQCKIAGKRMKLTAAGNVGSCQQYGNDTQVNVGGGIDSCSISGKNVTFQAGKEIVDCRISGEQTNAAVNASIGVCKISGNKATVTVDGDMDSCSISGKDAALTVKGNVNDCQLSVNGIDLSVEGNVGQCKTTGNRINLTFSGKLNDLQHYGDSMTAKIGGSVAKCRLSGKNIVLNASKNITECQFPGNGTTATVNGVIGKCDITGNNVSVALNKKVDDCQISGGTVTVKGSGTITNVDVYGRDCKVTCKYTTLTDHVAIYDYEHALTTVKTVDNWYKHEISEPYSTATMEGFVDQKGYSSKTEWLVWASTKTLTVNIFKGSKGNWKLVRSSPCAMGKPSTPTIKGVFSVYHKDPVWYFDHYNCYNATLFKGGYAFHSRLWSKNHSYLVDDSISCLVSAGCVRMYDEDCKYIYDNVPINSTVVVY